MFKIGVLPVFEATQRLIKVNPAYRTVPIQEGFNWTEYFSDVGPGEWYLVAFRSRYKADTDHELLNEYDCRALEAARTIPGLMTYFAGTPSEQGDCLSFCLWKNQQQAQLAAAQPAHRAAQAVACDMYEYFQLERYRLRKVGSAANGMIIFEPL